MAAPFTRIERQGVRRYTGLVGRFGHQQANQVVRQYVHPQFLLDQVFQTTGA
jgi:hypothetical protein